jgi:chaperone required for assembly of F1-ATPase
MTEWKARRFWKAVETAQEGGGFSVRLDGRPVRTPAKAALILPTRRMAEMVAAEWAAQGEFIDPEVMPATRAANAAIDKVALQKAEVVEMLAAYGDSDLLCYRADSPAELVERQALAWDPLLDWLAATYGVRLAPRTGVMPVPQDPDALRRLQQEVAALSAFELAAFHDLVSLSGSLVIGLAAARDVQPAPALWDVSRIDESWQAEQWGADDEAEQVAEVKRQSFMMAKEFFDASRI